MKINHNSHHSMLSKIAKYRQHVICVTIYIYVIYITFIFNVVDTIYSIMNNFWTVVMTSKKILINLKRFDVSRSMGGVCQYSEPTEWIENIIADIVNLNLGNKPEFEVCLFLPDILLSTAKAKLDIYPSELTSNFSVGTQSCHREDVSISGNFGAFTSFNIASTQKVKGSSASIIGHCEERKHFNHILQSYFADNESSDIDPVHASKVVSKVINEKTICALNVGMKATVCIGESAEERGNGTDDDQVANAKQVLKSQIINSLKGLSTADIENNIILAYEPIWAIGPGKTPPEQEYIGAISTYIKNIVKEYFSADVNVVYGGGLKNENAAMLAEIGSLDGGLIALTNFTPPIGFQTDELARILTTYQQAL